MNSVSPPPGQFATCEVMMSEARRGLITHNMNHRCGISFSFHKPDERKIPSEVNQLLLVIFVMCHIISIKFITLSITKFRGLVISHLPISFITFTCEDRDESYIEYEQYLTLSTSSTCPESAVSHLKQLPSFFFFASSIILPSLIMHTDKYKTDNIQFRKTRLNMKTLSSTRSLS